MKTVTPLLALLSFSLIGTALPLWAGYKARPWEISSPDSYAAKLTSEAVTIAVKPLFTDELAAQVFDRKDMVTRGIMPLAVMIFNDNDFPVEIDGLSIELINKDDHLHTLMPNETVYRLYKGDRSWLKQSIPGLTGSILNRDALRDFENKFLGSKIIAPHDKGWGFLYLHIPVSTDLGEYLSGSTLYIPNVFRRDDGSRMIFFEINIAPATSAGESSASR